MALPIRKAFVLVYRGIEPACLKAAVRLIVCGETSVTTLICLAPVPHSAGGTGRAFFRKTLVAGVAYLFVAGFAEAQPLHTNGWSNNPPAALNPSARKKS